MLVVASAVRVLNRVHGAATRARPTVALHAVLVEGTAGLQHRFVDALAAGDSADGRAARVRHSLALARRQPARQEDAR